MKLRLLLIGIIIIIISCAKVNDDGFYIEGGKAGIHRTTKTRYDENGYNIEGNNKLGYNRYGYNKQGFNKDGFNKDSIHRETNTSYNKDGYNIFGYNIHGFDEYGYDKEGFDQKGYNKCGFNRNGINKITNMKYDKNLQDIYGNRLVTNFKIGDYVDEWGDNTGDQFIYLSSIHGTFSNSATQNSDAYLKIMIDETGFKFKISEYNLNNRANVGDNPYLIIYTNKKEQFHFDYMLGDQGEFSEQGKVSIFNSDWMGYPAEKLMKVLSECDNVRIYIKGDYRSEYNFHIDTAGIMEIANLMNLKFGRY